MRTGNRCIGDTIRGRSDAGYADKSKSLLTLVLLAGLVLKTFYSTEIPSFAQTGSGAVASDAFSEASGMTDPVPEYRVYEASFAEVYPQREIRAGVKDCIRCEKNADVTDRHIRCVDGIYTGEDSLVEFSVNVEEEGFYDLALEYLPLAGRDAVMERSILIDGKLPYKELERVCYVPAKTSESGGLTERSEWITGVTYDRERRIAEPLSVYLTKGEHTVALLSVKEPMLLHQILFSPRKQVQEYRRIKGFWDAVGIRAAQGDPIMIEAGQVDGTSGQTAYPVQDGDWSEWEFEVEAAGYYHISVYERQSHVRGNAAYRKILLDGAVPFQEMERYGFVSGWGRKADTLADDAGEPYVFYLKEGGHTLRMEAVPGGADAENSGRKQAQPLAVDRIRIVPAGNAGKGTAGKQKAKK